MQPWSSVRALASVLLRPRCLCLLSPSSGTVPEFPASVACGAPGGPMRCLWGAGRGQEASGAEGEGRGRTMFSQHASPFGTLSVSSSSGIQSPGGDSGVHFLPLLPRDELPIVQKRSRLILLLSRSPVGPPSCFLGFPFLRGVRSGKRVLLPPSWRRGHRSLPRLA